MHHYIQIANYYPTMPMLQVRG